MGDYAPAMIRFYDVPDTDVLAVVEWLSEWRMGLDWSPDDDDADGPRSVILGRLYGDPSAPVSIVLDGVRGLVRDAPGSTWRLAADPAAEAPGEIVTHVPGLPLRSTLADTDEREVFTAKSVRAAIATGTVPDLLGDAYVAAIGALSGRAGVELTPKPCPACGDPEGPCEIGCSDPGCESRDCESHDACG